MGLRNVQCLISSDLVSPLTKHNKKGLDVYHNLGILGLHYENQEYIGPIKYHRVLARYYLGLITSSCSILPLPVTV